MGCMEEMRETGRTRGMETILKETSMYTVLGKALLK